MSTETHFTQRGERHIKDCPLQEPSHVAVGLTAVILAVTGEVPRALVTQRSEPPRGLPEIADEAIAIGKALVMLPSGPFDPERHRTLQMGLRQWVENQTGLSLRYVEQLYTLGNEYRDPGELFGGPRMVSVAYLALSHEAPVSGTGDAQWNDCYKFLPWEDWRQGSPAVVETIIRPGLHSWIESSEGNDGDARRRARAERVSLLFGHDADSPLSGELALERYELLYEAGLVPESLRDQTYRARSKGLSPSPPPSDVLERALRLGTPMALDNRRILAAALGRIRGKLAYRPVVFELLPTEFTLFRLQQVVEALAGMRLHKQNFRRMVVNGHLVEATGRMKVTGRGRPAELYRFHRDVMWTRPAVGIGLPHPRAPSSAL